MGVPDFSGLGPILIAGFVTIIAAYIAIPPGVFALIAWVFVDAQHAFNVWVWAQAIWLGILLGIYLAARATDWMHSREHRRRWGE